MNLVSRILFATCVLLSLTGAALADPMPKSLKDAYASVNKAVEKLDFKAFASHFHPDFVLIDPKGQETKRADFLASVKPMFDGFTSAKASTKVKSVHILGDYAEVSFVLNIEVTGKGGTMKMREEGTDSLIFQNGKWLLYKSVQEKWTMSGP